MYVCVLFAYSFLYFSSHVHCIVYALMYVYIISYLINKLEKNRTSVPVKIDKRWWNDIRSKEIIVMITCIPEVRSTFSHSQQNKRSS